MHKRSSQNKGQPVLSMYASNAKGSVFMHSKIIENHDELIHWMRLVENTYGRSILTDTAIHFVSGTYDDGTTGHMIEICDLDDGIIASSAVSDELVEFANKMNSVVQQQGSQSLATSRAVMH